MTNFREEGHRFAMMSVTYFFKGCLKNKRIDLGVDMLPTLHNLTSRLAKMYYQTSNEDYKNMDIETLIFINNSEKYARLLENVTHPAN